MPLLSTVLKTIRRQARACSDSVLVFVGDVGRGLLEVSHNTLALLGLIGVGAAVFFAAHTDVRHDLEGQVLGWLQARQLARAEPSLQWAAALNDRDGRSRATAADPKDLTRQQVAVAVWLSRRYRVAPEPISALVKEAWIVGSKVGLDPTLILSVMAIESSFNPFAQSPVGAQGLMQVMTGIHVAKYEPFGGNHAAFDPVTNLRVGVLVLKECIARAGSIDGGLRNYVGAANLPDDGGYANKVLAEQAHLKLVANGKSVAVTAPLPQPRPKLEAEAADTPRLESKPSIDADQLALR